MLELFIYYRAAVADAAAVEHAAVAFQRTLRERHPGLGARLLRRPQERDGLHTWMEAYVLPAGRDVALRADIEREAAALSRWIVGGRHVEAFLPCA